MSGNRTTCADSTTTESRYDARGMEISKADQNSRVISYHYDGLGRLTTVTDAFGQSTLYGYDEVGNQLTQTDP